MAESTLKEIIARNSEKVIGYHKEVTDNSLRYRLVMNLLQDPEFRIRAQRAWLQQDIENITQ